VRAEGHYRKARAFEDRAGRWETERDAPSAIEDLFDAFVHYVAYGLFEKYKVDIDSHKRQRKFLKENGEHVVLAAHTEIEEVRIGSVYGAAWNGERIERAQACLEVIKRWMPSPGGSIK
jgi:hypothetical protein